MGSRTRRTTTRGKSVCPAGAGQEAGITSAGGPRPQELFGLGRDVTDGTVAGRHLVEARTV